jgi:UDPglucose--hexose-1-phosphate uridylyltransferase
MALPSNAASSDLVMAELRRDPLTGRWVILAAQRAERPHEPGRATASTASEAVVDGCPFCPGHEHQTPPEVARRGPGSPDGPGWEVRVIPNLYPIVHGVTGDDVPGAGDLRQQRSAGGEHEVAVLSPDHHRSLADLDDRQVLQVLLTLRDRVRAHAAAGYVYTQVMVNHGLGGGASLSHPHAQIVAIEIAPPTVEEEVAHLTAGDECILCRELQRHEDDASPGRTLSCGVRGGRRRPMSSCWHPAGTVLDSRTRAPSSRP